MPQRARSRQSHLKDCRKPSKPQFVGERVKLGDLCSVCSGGTPKRSVSEYWNEGSIPWVKISDISGKFVSSTEELITEAGLKGSSAKLLAPGTLLYSIFASIGAVGILKIPAATNQAIAGLSIKTDRIERDYLYHFLKSRESLAKSSGRGAAQNNINLTILRGMEVPVPAIGEQKAIVEQLEIIAAQIKQAETQLDQLDSLVKSRFVEMFGDPCDPGSSSAKNRIDSFCELRIGPFGSALHKEDYITGGHPLVNPSHIIGGAIRPDENLTIDDGKYESLASYHLLPGDVVLGRRGEIGRCAVVKTDGLICGTGSMIIRPGQKVRSDYLQRVVSFPSFSHALEANAVGVTMKNLNAKIVGSAEVFLPDLKDQDACITLVSQIDK